jgi:hypothetical protein
MELIFGTKLNSPARPPAWVITAVWLVVDYQMSGGKEE